MVEVGLAFVCALVAWSVTAALIARGQRDGGTYAKVLAGSAVALAVALSAAFPGALLGFSGLTFRVWQIGAGLFGPLLAAWGALEYAVASPRVRFGVRLVVTTLAVVPLVVLALDPVRSDFGGGYPPQGEHYDVIPGIALAAVHVFAVLALAGAAAAALRGRAPGHRASVAGLLALAVLLEIAVARLGLGIFGQVLMLGALGALWAAFMRAQNPPEEPQGRRRGGRRRGGRGRRGDGEWDDDGDDGEDEAVFGRRRKAEPEDDYGYDDDRDDYGDPYGGARGGRAPAGGGRPSRMRGVITIYALAEGRADDFDDVADLVVDEVARREPDTLLFACHTVPSAPLQRIVYAIYRDDLAMEEHEQQPHVREFARRTAHCVTATNVIELALEGAAASDHLAAMLMPR
ncbi:antibiotic biosynthesis monooxygenase [Nocardiopsis sp. RSe5-2]|uniref:Antibiotic biosynthesis monooxygenase n=1 Tax=Nocardiopsis endophytica TaxID=3018445 RepID=A0ABT4U1C6_9ACTN|nr:antibiotic biosynthesis monooxygenase [Nocardiopsis endophytica]MDA2810761.1 antibiotic biosynthesis monooxygenase [Nocardiopsis endophytica]